MGVLDQCNVHRTILNTFAALQDSSIKIYDPLLLSLTHFLHLRRLPFPSHGWHPPLHFTTLTTPKNSSQNHTPNPFS